MRTLSLLLLAPAIAAAQARPTTPALARTLAELRAGFSGERALATTAFVAQYWRVPGNIGFNASIKRAAVILDSAGFVAEDRAAPGSRLVYRIERRPMSRPTWDPVDASFTIVGQAKPLLRYATNRHMLGMYSVSTPQGGVEGDLVDVGEATAQDFAKTEVAGKIVVADGSLRQVWTEAVRKRGALGALAYNMPAYTRPDINQGSIQFTGIPYDSAAAGWGIALSYAARQGLRSALASGPVRVRVETQSRIYPADELTLVAEIRGSRRPAERFVFSAHVQEPGANDNASGVGALAEMARTAAMLVRAGQEDPARTITFLFGDETVSTRRFITEDSARARGVLWGMSLDMVGEDTRKTGGTFLIEKMPDPSAVWTRGDDHHTEWGGSPVTKDRLMPHYFNDFVLDRCLDQAEENGWVVRTNPYEGGSDHVPFLQAGKPGLLLWHFTDQFYHTDGDRIEMVSAAELRNSGICALSTALALASADGATAALVVDQVKQDAIDRLTREAALSRTAVSQGGSRDHELEILAAWGAWYRGALDAVREVEVGGPSPATIDRIEAAKRDVDGALEQARKQVVPG
jgi:aminopeptidase YwaD